MTALIALVSLVAGAILGFWGREVIDYLKGIKSAVLSLKIKQDKKEQLEKKMAYADPADFNWDTMDDQEKINFLNS